MEDKTRASQIYKVIAVIGLFVAWALVSCENPSTVNQKNYSLVKGRIADDGGQSGMRKPSNDMEGIAVLLARMTADGSLETVSQETVHTDASGRFTLRTQVENENNLIVVATKGATQWRAVVNGDIENGQTTYCAPLSQETTVETEVFLRIRMYDQGGTITYADVQRQVDTDVATEVSGDGVGISQLASAIETGINAQSKVFMNDSMDVSDKEIESITKAKAELQAKLDAQLYHSSGNHPDEEMHETFLNGYLEAYGNAGVDLGSYARSQNIAFSAAMNTTGSLRDSLRFDFLQQLALFRAEVIDLMIQSRFEALGASDSVDTAVIDAGTDLHASINGATTLDEIRTAFAVYHSTIVDLLRITLDVDAELITQLDSNIWGDSGIYGSLEHSLSVTLSTDAIIHAYTDFYSTVEAEALTVLDSITADVNVTVVVSILVMSNFMA